VGIATSERGEARDLLEEADRALYRAKRSQPRLQAASGDGA
jgi:PleD family two-component response regulator